MAESQDIIITFKADTTGLTPAVDVLEKLGTVTKKDADEFKKANTATQDFNKTAKNTAAILDGNGKALLVNADKVKKLGDETAKAGKQIKDSSKEIEGGFGGIKNALSGIAEGIAAAFSIQKIISFGKESINAFVEAEAQTNRLRFAIENITKDGGAFDSLIKQSEELQKLTFFDAEDIQNAQAIQAQFGLTAAQIRKLTPLITELAVAQNTDLASATETTLRAIEGQTKGLKTLGADFKDTGSKIENFNLVVENLAKIQGTAADALNTTSGQLKKQNVELENIQEEIGQRLAPAFVNLKRVILEAAAGLVGLKKEAGKQGNVSIFEDLLKDVSDDKLKIRLSALKEQVIDYQKTVDELKKRNEGKGLNVSQTDQKELKAANDLLTITQDKFLAINNVLQKRLELQAEVNRNAEIEIFRKKDLEKLSIDGINAEIKLLKSRNDNNTIDVKDEIERREAAIDKRLEAEKKANEKALDEKHRFADDLAALEKDIAKKSELELAKTEQERLAITLKYALLELDIKRKAAGVVDTDKAYLTAKKNLYDAYDKAVLDADNKQKEQAQKLRDKDLKADEDAQAGIIKNLEETNAEADKLEQDRRENQLKLEEQFREDRKQLIYQIEDEATQGLFGLYQANLDAQIALLEEQQTREQDLLDTAEKNNQDRFDKRQITAKQFYAEEKRLTDEKVRSEKIAQDKINEIKRRADIADRAEKVFQIAIATARNVVEAALTPTLIPFLIGLGAFQTAAVLAQPLPKYHSGRLASNNSMEEHAIIRKDETVVNPQNSKDYHPSLKAIHNRSIPAEALNNFVKGFSYKPTYVSSSTSNSSLSIDYEKLSKAIAWEMRGSSNVNIKNIKQLADALQTDNDTRRIRG